MHMQIASHVCTLLKEIVVPSLALLNGGCFPTPTLIIYHDHYERDGSKKVEILT